ncbi:MAG: M16 family metallopeptidase, partial [Luteolibacter sp.]
NAEPAALEQERQIEVPEPPQEKEWTYPSKIPQGLAIVVWKTPGLRNRVPEFRRLNILSSILGDRMREEIREKLGASYSPNAGARGSDGLEGVGYLIGQSAGKPDELPILVETMLKEAASLASEGASADELDRALKPQLGMLEESARDNSYWLETVLSQSQSDPEKITLARQRDEDYRNITLSEINELAARYLAKENALKIQMRAVAPKISTEKTEEQPED